MENASKALIMAGGVLIALMVASLVVFFFKNISEWQGMQESGQELEQMVEFNQQYEVYGRDVYGSELLSIANKIADYNKRQAEDKGYLKIELQVQLTKDMDTSFFKKGNYNSMQMKTEVENLQAEIKRVGDQRITSRSISTVSRKISQLASMRTKDIEELGIEYNDYRIQLTQYNTYKTLLTQVKETIFKFVTFDYDKTNGRITKMTYKL